MRKAMKEMTAEAAMEDRIAKLERENTELKANKPFKVIPKKIQTLKKEQDEIRKEIGEAQTALKKMRVEGSEWNIKGGAYKDAFFKRPREYSREDRIRADKEWRQVEDQERHLESRIKQLRNISKDKAREIIRLEKELMTMKFMGR